SMVFHSYLIAANPIIDWKDSNGNVITYAPDGLGGLTITDTLGRVVTIATSSVTYAPGLAQILPTSITYKVSNAALQTITLGYSALTLAPTFSQPPPSWMAYPPYSITVPILNSLTLANGRSYSMQYNNFGELTKLTYPAGGYTRYTYGALQGWYQ